MRRTACLPVLTWLPAFGPNLVFDMGRRTGAREA